MKYTEDAALINCAGATLAAILTQPEAPADTGVIIIVGGPQYRAGSHRQFVHLCRALATAGYPAVRFDYRGMGDSSGEKRDFLAVDADIASMIDFMHARVPQVRNIVLWGLCDGASAALLYCHATKDCRIKGLCLLNPWIRSEVSLAKTQVKHYYSQRLREKAFWLKLISGKVAATALTGLARGIKTAFFATKSKVAPSDFLPFQVRMSQAWKNFNGPILLLLSADDFTAKEIAEHGKTSGSWSGLLEQPSVERQELSNADHTCSSAALRMVAEKQTVNWLGRCVLGSR